MPSMKGLSDLVGDSPGIRAVRETVARLLVRQQDVRRLPSILIQGETGTGKGLLARMIHRAGPRPDGPFIDVNCAAIPDTLLEAEMFGFERGAFTDARRSKPGLFQAAHRGTIFLDEVGLLPEALQAKLLKVLEERTVRRLGATRDEAIDVWVITATNEDLKVAIRERRFREDLYHRLAVLTVTLPPLRDRGGDILALAEHFLARVCGEYSVPPKTLGRDAQAAMRAYRWPGNVRELSNVIERAVLMSTAGEITAEALALGDAGTATPAPPAPVEPAVSLDDAMREHLTEVLTQTGWNISRTAALLGISRNTLRARMDKYGLRERDHGHRPTSRKSASPVVPPAPVVETPRVVAPSPVPVAAARRWERRPVALLRTALVPPAGPDAWLETARALEVAVDKVRTFGGKVESIGPIGLVAAFGLEAAGDAADRAAHAALAILKASERAHRDTGSEVGVKLGLHTTQVLVGVAAGVADVDMEERRDLWPVLDALIERAPLGGILVTGSAAQILLRRFELASGAGHFIGAGAAQLLVGRERTGLGLGGRTAECVGRDHELRLLRTRLNSALQGQGQVIGIGGAAGIGKSRLLFELRQIIAGLDLTYLEAHCHSYGVDVPYLPVIELLKGLCGFIDDDTPDVIRARVEGTLRDLGMDVEAATPYVLHLLGLKGDPMALDALPAEAVKARLLDTVHQLVLRRASSRPLVVAMDDVHWIDRSSEDCVRLLVDALAGAKIFMIATYRPGYRPPWIDKSYATQISLQPLGADDARRVLGDALGATGELSAGIVETILTKADGNPFFIEEIARAIREQNGSSDTLAIPDTIQDVLLGRMDHLDPRDRQLLQVCAVIGKDFAWAVAKAVVDLPDEGLREAFRRLTAAEFLYETPAGSEPAFRFRHALTHEIAYGSLVPDERRSLHGRIAAVIARIFADRLGDHIERLAHHARRGERWSEAVDYCRQAGAKAMAGSAYREAASFLEQALEALEHLPADTARRLTGIDIRVDLRAALTPLGEHDRIFGHLRLADAVAQSVNDTARLGRVAAYESDYFRLVGDHEQAITYGQRALEAADALGDPGLRVIANTYLGLVHRHRGEYRRAIEFFRSNLDTLTGDRMWERFGMIQLPSVHSRVWMAACLTELGEFVEAQTLVGEGIRLAESAGHPMSRIVAQFGLGDVCLRQGEFNAAIDALMQGLELSRAWNVTFWSPRLASALGVALAQAGRVSEALPMGEEAVRRYAAVRQLGGHALILTELATIYSAAHRSEDARRLATEALELAEHNGERGHGAWALRLLSELAMVDRHDVEQARAFLDRARVLAGELNMRPLAGHCHVLMARAERAAGKRDAAAAHLAAARTLFSEMSMTRWSVEAAEALARLG